MRPRLLAPAAPTRTHTPLQERAWRALLEDAQRALAGHGRVVLLAGPPGAGKSRLLQELRQVLATHASRPAVVAERCATDGRDVWLRIAAAAERRRRLWRAAVSLLPDWMALVPVAGNVLSAVTATAVAVSRRGQPEEAEANAALASAPAAVRDLVGRSAGPLAVLLDRGEQADAPDLAGIAALVRQLRARPILLVVAAVPGAGPNAGALRDIVLEAERAGRGRRLELPALPAPGERPGAADDAISAGMAPDDVALLDTAALQGPVFRSLLLARKTGLPELELEERLLRLARAGILDDHGVEEHEGELTGVYALRRRPADGAEAGDTPAHGRRR